MFTDTVRRLVQQLELKLPAPAWQVQDDFRQKSVYLAEHDVIAGAMLSPKRMSQSGIAAQAAAAQAAVNAEKARAEEAAKKAKALRAKQDGVNRRPRRRRSAARASRSWRPCTASMRALLREPPLQASRGRRGAGRAGVSDVAREGRAGGGGGRGGGGGGGGSSSVFYFKLHVYVANTPRPSPPPLATDVLCGRCPLAFVLVFVLRSGLLTSLHNVSRDPAAFERGAQCFA
jgi:hypothetical protein